MTIRFLGSWWCPIPHCRSVSGIFWQLSASMVIPWSCSSMVIPYICVMKINYIQSNLLVWKSVQSATSGTIQPILSNGTVGPRLSGYPATSYPNISIIRLRSCSAYCLFFIHFHKNLAQNSKTMWMNFCFINISFYVHFIWMIICYKYNSNV